MKKKILRKSTLTRLLLGRFRQHEVNFFQIFSPFLTLIFDTHTRKDIFSLSKYLKKNAIAHLIVDK